jgi:hypothetical protein
MTLNLGNGATIPKELLFGNGGGASFAELDPQYASTSSEVAMGFVALQTTNVNDEAELSIDQPMLHDPSIYIDFLNNSEMDFPSNPGEYGVLLSEDVRLLY